jgi:hypothetical protein
MLVIWLLFSAIFGRCFTLFFHSLNSKTSGRQKFGEASLAAAFERGPLIIFIEISQTNNQKPKMAPQIQKMLTETEGSPQTDILILPAPSLEMYLIQKLRPRPPLNSSLLHHLNHPQVSSYPHILYSRISITLRYVYIRLRPYSTNIDSVLDSTLPFWSPPYFAQRVAPGRAR